MAIPPTKRTNRTWVWAVSVLLVFGIFFVVRAYSRNTLGVHTYTVQRGSIKSTLSTNGKVQPSANYEVHAPFAGLVTTLSVHEGDRVRRGQLLLTLNDAEARARLESALAALESARAGQDALSHGGTQEERLALRGDTGRQLAERDAARQSLATIEKLAATGAASPSEVAAAQSRLRNDEAALQVLEQRKSERYDAADLGRARAVTAQAQAAVDAASQAIADANVRAPFDGTVYSLLAARTDYAQQGDRLLQMADLSKMEVLAYFDEPDIGRLTVGQPVTIRWVAKPDREWHGHISRLPATVITYTTRNVGEVFCTIDDADGELLPNTNVMISVTTADIGDALSVPREALHTEGGQSYVYRVVHDRLKRTQVRVGTLNLTQIQIISGVSAGDQVALNSTTTQPLVDGTPVDIVP